MNERILVALKECRQARAAGPQYGILTLLWVACGRRRELYQMCLTTVGGDTNEGVTDIGIARAIERLERL